MSENDCRLGFRVKDSSRNLRMTEGTDLSHPPFLRRDQEFPVDILNVRNTSIGLLVVGGNRRVRVFSEKDVEERRRPRSPTPENVNG